MYARGHGSDEKVTCFGIFCFRGFRRSLAAARSFERCSFAAFMSLGALVRSCLMCVGTRVMGCATVGKDSQGAAGWDTF